MTAISVGALRDTTSAAMSFSDAFQARSIWPSDAVSAELIAREGREARIDCEGTVHAARIAFGCLIQPEPGDRVLTSLADGAIWIVSVLERRSAAPTRLWAEGDLGIVSTRGDISLAAGRNIDLGAGINIRAAAPEIDLHASMAQFVLDEMLQIGRRVSWYVSKLRSIGEVAETFADHVLTRAKRGSRFIEESDQVRAGSIDHRAEGTLQLHANVAFVTAETVVRVDADQIHMG